MNLLRGRRRAEETVCDALKEKRWGCRQDEYWISRPLTELKNHPTIGPAPLGIEPNMTQYHRQQLTYGYW